MGLRAHVLCLGRVRGSAGNSHASGALVGTPAGIADYGNWAVGRRARGLSRRALLFLTATALLLSINWLTFIWAIQAQRIADASLGYFINPLVNVLLGGLFLRERMRPYQWLAVGVALLGVGAELWVQRSVPWLGLILAVSFGFYGLLRKQVSVPAAIGLWVETTLMLPIALLFLFWLVTNEGLRPVMQVAQLAMGGLVSVVPLVFFAAATVALAADDIRVCSISGAELRVDASDIFIR